MFDKHVITHLTAYSDGALTSAETRRIESHLQHCSKCRAAYHEIQFGARLASALSVSKAPESLWNDLHRLPDRAGSRRWMATAVFASALVVLVATVVWKNAIPAGPFWEVTGVPGIERLRPGEVLQTDPASVAELKMADIGELTIDPDTRIRLLVTQPDEHRLALDRGRIEASTWSPPRLFIVETPSAVAVDLGCRYTLDVEDDGSSMLHVTLGLVALERDGRETIVPAGAFCRTRPASGPGTPFFEDSSAELQSALALVDSGTEGAERTRRLEIVLREARVRDALSLWHLLPRMDAPDRGLIYDRLTELITPPPGVTRDGIIALDPAMLEAWKKIVSQLWQ